MRPRLRSEPPPPPAAPGEGGAVGARWGRGGGGYSRPRRPQAVGPPCSHGAGRVPTLLLRPRRGGGFSPLHGSQRGHLEEVRARPHTTSLAPRGAAGLLGGGGAGMPPALLSARRTRVSYRHWAALRQPECLHSAGLHVERLLGPGTAGEGDDGETFHGNSACSAAQTVLRPRSGVRQLCE